MAQPAPQIFHYLRDPAAIYARSFAEIDARCDLSGYADDVRPVVRRVVHACGLPAAADAFAASADFAKAVRQALDNGARIVADCRMVAAGIMQSRLPAGPAVTIALDAPGVAAVAKAMATTRSAAAMDASVTEMDGAIVVIGNAPTALFRLLELCHAGRTRPAAVIGMPVGFVGAQEAKEQLVRSAGEQGLAFATVHGLIGGSAIAAATLNAFLAESGR